MDVCSALHSMEGQICSANRRCNALLCELAGQRVKLSVLPCRDPPGIRVVIYDSSDQVTFTQFYYGGSHVISGEDIPLPLNVTVEQISKDSLFIQVCAHDAYSVMHGFVYCYEWWLYMCYGQYL